MLWTLLLVELTNYSHKQVAVDATSSLDLQDIKLIRFVTRFPAGGIPLGYILLSHENEETLLDAFGKKKKNLPCPCL